MNESEVEPTLKEWSDKLSRSEEHKELVKINNEIIKLEEEIFKKLTEKVDERE